MPTEPRPFPSNAFCEALARAEKTRAAVSKLSKYITPANVKTQFKPRSPERKRAPKRRMERVSPPTVAPPPPLPSTASAPTVPPSGPVGKPQPN